MNKSAIIPLSGGLDSTTIAYIMKYERGIEDLHLISFNYGQRHSVELDFANYVSAKLESKSHQIIDLDFFPQISTNSALTNDDVGVPDMKDVLGHPQPPTYVPFRNQLLLTICCSYAETMKSNIVCHGAAEIDTHSGYWDGSIEFIENMNKLLNLNRSHKITLEAPLIKMSKAEIITKALELGADLSRTWTCYNPPVWDVTPISCGKCPSCSSRIQGFIEAGVKDPMEYVIDIDWETLI